MKNLDKSFYTDTLIAEKIMDWYVNINPENGIREWFHKDGIPTGIEYLSWKPSKNLDNALDVIEKLKERGIETSITYIQYGKWRIIMSSENNIVLLESDSYNLPFTICKAAFFILGILKDSNT